jgi:hypothetical protein
MQYIGESLVPVDRIASGSICADGIVINWVTGGIFRRSKQRWNRWIGRIVFAERTAAGILYTVKIHGEEWTIKGFGPIVGEQQPSRPWDVVNVVVDPQKIDLAIAAPCLVMQSSERRNHS